MKWVDIGKTEISQVTGRQTLLDSIYLRYPKENSENQRVGMQLRAGSRLTQAGSVQWLYNFNREMNKF